MALPSLASAADFSSTTLLFVGPDIRDVRDGEVRTSAPIYELVTLRVRDEENPAFDDVNVYVSLWGRIDTASLTSGNYAAGDVNLAFVEGKALERRLTLRLGRHFVYAGAIRPTQLDGLSATLDLPGGLGLSAFGGLPVASRFGVAAGDLMWGSRLFWRHSLDAEVGLSVAHVLDDGDLARFDLGLDARVVPHEKLVLTASGLFAPHALKLRMFPLPELRAAATLRPIEKLFVAVNFLRTIPELLLPPNSLYTMFSLGSRDEIGGSVTVLPVPRIRVYGHFHAIVIGEGDPDTSTPLGYHAGGKLSFTLGPRGATRFGVEGRFLTIPTNGFVNFRAFGRHRFAKRLLLSLDAAVYLFEEPIRDTTFGVTASGSLAYDIKSWRFLISGSGGVTPLWERRIDLMFKAAYTPFGRAARGSR